MSSGTIPGVTLQTNPHRIRRGLAAAAVVAALGLAGCGTGGPAAEPAGTATPGASTSAPAASPSASPRPSIAPSDDLTVITVTEGDKPEVKIPAPWAVDQTRTRVLKAGTGQKLNEASIATLNYAGYNARTGEVFDSSWERGAPATFPLQGVVPGFRKGLEGQTVGSRVLIAIPSEDGYAQGNPQAGIEVGDTIVFVVDIISANFDEATGEAVEPAAGLPKVTMTAKGPELATPEGAAPAKLTVQPLIKGPGTPVTSDASVQVKYRSWVWGTGKLWEDAWLPQQGKLETLIKGWQEGLLGQTAGSRVMLVVPPELAYPNGVPDKDLPAGQTLVYVIDILDTNIG